MRTARMTLELALLVAGAPGLLSAIELRPDTLKAWNDYIQNADSRMHARLDGQHPFLWTDEAPDRSPRIRRGEILVVPVAGRGTQSVANGLIHDWSLT